MSTCMRERRQLFVGQPLQLRPWLPGWRLPVRWAKTTFKIHAALAVCRTTAAATILATGETAAFTCQQRRHLSYTQLRQLFVGQQLQLRPWLPWRPLPDRWAKATFTQHAAASVRQPLQLRTSLPWRPLPVRWAKTTNKKHAAAAVSRTTAAAAILATGRQLPVLVSKDDI